MNASSKAKQKYNNKTYDRLQLMLPKGLKTEWTEKANQSGLSLTAYIVQCVKIAQSEEEVCKNKENE